MEKLLSLFVYVFGVIEEKWAGEFNQFGQEIRRIFDPFVILFALHVPQKNINRPTTGSELIEPLGNFVVVCVLGAVCVLCHFEL